MTMTERANGHPVTCYCNDCSPYWYKTAPATSPSPDTCPKCESSVKSKRMMLVYQEPYGHQELCPDHWHAPANSPDVTKTTEDLLPGLGANPPKSEIGEKAPNEPFAYTPDEEMAKCRPWTKEEIAALDSFGKGTPNTLGARRRQEAATSPEPICWHKEIDHETGICKACGVKAAIKLPFTPEEVRLRVAKSESRHLPRVQDAASQIEEEMTSPLNILCDLLAVIHRDGGQYTGQHGILKSGDDGEKIVADLLRESEENADLRRQLQEAQARIERYIETLGILQRNRDIDYVLQYAKRFNLL